MSCPPPTPPTTLAAWRCEPDDPTWYQLRVLDWLDSIGCPLWDDGLRGVQSVRLERHGDTTTVVVTRRTPAGVLPVRERHEMTTEPPARPSTQEDQ